MLRGIGRYRKFFKTIVFIEIHVVKLQTFDTFDTFLALGASNH